MENRSGHQLNVGKTVAAGNAINPSVAKAGVTTIANGDTGLIVSLSRIGKSNWMDPTPRALEPGKTYRFATAIDMLGAAGEKLMLKQRLKGTGKSSKMWYSLAGTIEAQDWHNDQTPHIAVWEVTPEVEFAVEATAIPGQKDADVRYVVRPIAD